MATGKTKKIAFLICTKRRAEMKNAACWQPLL